MGMTPLGIAVSRGGGANRRETVEALLRGGADPCAIASSCGATVLHAVALGNDSDEAFVKYILELPGVQALVDTPMRPQNNKWKLRYWIAGLRARLGSSKQAVVRAMSEWPLNTALATAALSGNTHVMKVLVEEGGANRAARNKRGRTAFDQLPGRGEDVLPEIKQMLA